MPWAVCHGYGGSSQRKRQARFVQFGVPGPVVYGHSTHGCHAKLACPAICHPAASQNMRQKARSSVRGSGGPTTGRPCRPSPSSMAPPSAGCRASPSAFILNRIRRRKRALHRSFRSARTRPWRPRTRLFPLDTPSASGLARSRRRAFANVLPGRECNERASDARLRIGESRDSQMCNCTS